MTEDEVWLAVVLVDDRLPVELRAVASLVLARGLARMEGP